jgi:hypothetical protein
MSWEQLISIIEDSAEEASTDASTPPVACPNDGEPLSTGPRGELFCRWDGYRYEGTQ